MKSQRERDTLLYGLRIIRIPFDSMAIKRLKTQKRIRCILPLPDGVHALATCFKSYQIWKVNIETGDMKLFCGMEEGREG